MSEHASVHAPATGVEKAAWAMVAGGLVFVFHFNLVPALAAGLLVYALLRKMTHHLHGPRLSQGAAKFLAAALFGLLATGLTVLAVVFIVGLVRGHLGDLPLLFQKMADVLDQSRGQLEKFGVTIPDTLVDADEMQAAVSTWLREHSKELTHTGTEAGRMLLHAVMGIVLGLLSFFHHPHESPGPLAVALAERLLRITNAFEAVVFAQVEISALNTFFTGLYLIGLHVTGHGLPFSFTLVTVTFVAGLLPVLGNLISNSVIVVISLSVSPWIALCSLIFLVVIHKLEYFVNAKIVGARIHAAAWETLLAILSFEVALGIAGVVMAPVLYAYVKKELSDRGLV